MGQGQPVEKGNKQRSLHKTSKHKYQTRSHEQMRFMPYNGCIHSSIICPSDCLRDECKTSAVVRSCFSLSFRYLKASCFSCCFVSRSRSSCCFALSSWMSNWPFANSCCIHECNAIAVIDGFEQCHCDNEWWNNQLVADVWNIDVVAVNECGSATKTRRWRSKHTLVAVLKFSSELAMGNNRDRNSAFYNKPEAFVAT